MSLFQKCFFGAFIIGLVTACSSPQKTSYQPSVDQRSMALLEEAMQDLENESYTSASYKLEKLVNKNPVTEFDLVILYNTGVAQEGLKNCDLAVKRYRSVARIAHNKFEKVGSLALYRLGFAYDCLGKAKSSLIAFLDARKKSRYLPEDVASAELPARLAAAYASLGRQKEALFYFNEASAGLKRLLSKSGGGPSDKKLAANTMYAMGKMSHSKHPLTFVRMLAMQQPFLLQAIELQISPSSSKAEKELKEAYHRVLSQKINDKKIAREFYIEALKASRQLQRLKLPKSEGATGEVFKLVDRTEAALQNRLAKLSDTLKKTPEEKKRGSLKKEVK